MTAAEALDTIQRAAVSGRFHIGTHARLRMRERGATAADVRHALSTAKRCRLDTSSGETRWKVESADLDGDDLTAIVSIEAGMVVVTLF